MKDGDCKHEEAKSFTQEDKKYLRNVAKQEIPTWKKEKTLRSKMYAPVVRRTRELLDQACAEGKEITPELEQKILEQVYKEFGI